MSVPAVTTQTAPEEEGKRAKRSTRFSGDFQNLFGEYPSSEDEKDLKKKSISSSNKTTKKTKECPGCGAVLTISVRECRLCDYQFTSKSMVMSQQSILQESMMVRDRFPFEPERDEDGSLIIQLIFGRTPRKTGRRWLQAAGAATLADMSAMDAKYDYEYLIKYKNMSHLHVQWLSAIDIESMSQKSKKVLNKYLTSLDKGDPTVTEDGEIDPSFTEVEKILDYREEDVQEVIDDLNPQQKTSSSPNGKEKDLEKENSSTQIESKSSVTDDPVKIEYPSLPPPPPREYVSTSIYQNRNLPTKEGEEVVLSNNQIFQPAERCRKVLEKIWEDPYSISFQEPVDTKTYDDYLDVIEEPICLKDIQEKIDTGEYSKYGQYTRFAKDMRKMFSNCKLYNLYKSPIWFCAHALSMTFERLYQAYIVSFSDGSIPMSESIARPWETPCRVCDTEDNDEKMMLCDHCDAAYHIYCLKPRLSKVPEDAWMCPRCLNWFARTGAKVLSATAEDEARQLVEGASSRKVIKVKKRKYLVKWRGLSYRDCTWETAKDINDDEKIAEYHRINDSPPDEPPLTQAEIGVELAKDRKSQPLPAGTNMGKENPVTDLEAQVYSQIRSYHFLKYNKDVPAALLKECGPATHAYTLGVREPLRLPKYELDKINEVITNSVKYGESDQNDETQDDDLMDFEEPDDSDAPKEKVILDKSLSFYSSKRNVDSTTNTVTELLSEALYSVARDHEKVPINAYPSRPPIPSRYTAPSEIEVCIPKSDGNVGVKIGCFNNNLVVLGFRAIDEYGKKGSLESTFRIKIGDVLVAINGLYIYELKFQKVLRLLKSCDFPYLYLRFLRYPPSVEAKNINSIENYMSKKRKSNKNRRIIPLRSLYFGVYPVSDESSENNSDDKLLWAAEYYKNYEKIRIGVFEDELSAAQAYDKAITSYPKDETEDVILSSNINFNEDGSSTTNAIVLNKIVSIERGLMTEKEPIVATESEEKNNAEKDVDETQKTSNSEPVDEMKMSVEPDPAVSGDIIADPVVFEAVVESKDAVPDDEQDDDFYSYDSRDSDSENRSYSSESDVNDEDAENVSEDSKSNDWDSGNEDTDWVPTAKEALCESDGAIGRLLRAVNETDYPPFKSDWSNYILELGVTVDDSKTKSRKIEQVDMASNELIRAWDSMVIASRAANISVNEIQSVLLNRTDSAGGFKWRYGAVIENSAEREAEEEENEELEKKAEESWKSKLPTKSKEYKSGGTLRDYQVEGLSWLLRCWYSKRSSILADEMGLGKTVQVVTFLDHLFEVESIKGPFLVCVPLSTIGHWKREFEAWSAMMVCLYHDVGGGRDMRDVIREFEWYYKGRSHRLLKFHVLILTYDDLVRDYEELAEIPWRVVIVDEAHRLRNVNSKLLECFRSVVTKGQLAYGYQHRVLMTGTPLQNNTTELWSLLNFIEPAKFPDQEKFFQRFGNIVTQEQVENLQRRIGPHLLRRVKEDVAKDIPPKEETIIDVELTTMQKQYYRAIFEHNHGFLMQNLKGNLPKLMNIQMELRKCCNHTFLIHGVEQNEMEMLEKSVEDATLAMKPKLNRANLVFDQKEFERRRMEEILIPSSGKMVLLDKLLPKLRKENHKVLIFSQMVKMIDVIEEFCDFRKYPCERLDGRVSGNDRQKAIDRYNKEVDSFVFLLSTRAGGVGINLTAADTVIIFDSDWNPQNDIQAMARCHRIGQKKNVTVYRLITRRSFESEMFQRASKKLGLEQAVLGTRNFNDIDFDENKNAKIDAKEMEQLLREGAYAVLLEDDTDMVKEFYEQDIDKILEQRSHVIVTESVQQTESWLNKRKKHGRTSKSMFTGESAKEHAEIDVNDPDFWKKVLPDLVTPDSMFDRLQDDSMIPDDDDREIVEKYMKDLTQMMDGMLDLNRRNQLPERERAVCMKLLLRITLKVEVFDEEERTQAEKWLSFMEGARIRRNRQDLYSVEEFRREKGSTDKNKRNSKFGSSGKKGRRRSIVVEDDIEDGDNDDDADPNSDDDSDRKKTPSAKKGQKRAYRFKDKKNKEEDTVTPKGRRMSKGSNKKEKSGEEKGTGRRKKRESVEPEPMDEEPPVQIQTGSKRRIRFSIGGNSEPPPVAEITEKIEPSGEKKKRGRRKVIKDEDIVEPTEEPISTEINPKLKHLYQSILRAKDVDEIEEEEEEPEPVEEVKSTGRGRKRKTVDETFL